METEEMNLPETEEQAIEETFEEPIEEMEDGDEQPTGQTEEPSQTETAEETTLPAPASVTVTDEQGTRELSMEEVAVFAQKGMAYETIEPAWTELCRMAEERGQTPQKLIEALAKADDQVLYDRLLREAGGNRDVADRLMELEKSKRRTAREETRRQRETAAQSEREANTERLAAEFLELQAEFPEYEKFGDLPKAAVVLAVQKNIHLMDAVARWQRAEHRKIEKNNKATETAAAASVGSLAADVPESDSVDPLVKAMREGLHSVW